MKGAKRATEESEDYRESTPFHGTIRKQTERSSLERVASKDLLSESIQFSGKVKSFYLLCTQQIFMDFLVSTDTVLGTEDAV